MIEHLNKAEMQAILDLAAIGHSLKTPLMLIGANARRLAFDIPFGFASPRTTQDWDFAAPLANWDAFTRFYERAIQGSKAAFRAGDSAHRFIHLDTGILVDVVPFGPLAGAEGNIRWPQSQQVMSVLGFEEAFEACACEKLPNGVDIRIVTPPLLAVLKLIAFSERGEQVPRDLHDLWFIMERYAHPPTQESRVFNELAEHFPDESFYEHLNPLLLGWDIGRQCRKTTLAAIGPILHELASENSWRIESLLPRTSDAEEREAGERKIKSEFGWLRKGIHLAASVHKFKSQP